MIDHVNKLKPQYLVELSTLGLLPSVIGRHKRRLLAEDDEPEEVAHGL